MLKIEPPGGDPTRALSGSRVWHRGKESIVLDLHSGDGSADMERLWQLVQRADVVIESAEPGALRPPRPHLCPGASAQSPTGVLRHHRLRRPAASRRPAIARCAGGGSHRTAVGEARMARRIDRAGERSGPVPPRPARSHPRRWRARRARDRCTRRCRGRVSAHSIWPAWGSVRPSTPGSERVRGAASPPHCSRARWSTARSPGNGSHTPTDRATACGSPIPGCPTDSSAPVTAGGSIIGHPNRASC